MGGCVGIRISLDELNVIGYADVLSEDLISNLSRNKPIVGTIVPPVFSFKNDNTRVLVPPFKIEDGFVKDAIEILYSEAFNDLDGYSITLFPETEKFPAKDGFVLWVDGNMIFYKYLTSTAIQISTPGEFNKGYTIKPQ